MRQFVVAALLVAVGALATPTAHAAASASVTVNGVTRTLSQTGFLFEPIGGTAVSLGPGQSADYSFSYSITERDDGLTASFDPQANGCLALHLVGCNPSYTGFEFAKVELAAFYVDPRNIPPYIRTS